MKKKISLLILLIVGMLAFPKDMLASAVIIDETELNAISGTVNGSESGKAIFDADNHTLTLDNYVGSGIFVNCDADFTIILKGDNKILTPADLGTAIFTEGSDYAVIITGDGTLTFDDKEMNGIVNYGTLVIESTTVSCSDYKDFCISVDEANGHELTIDDAIINISNTDSEDNTVRNAIFAPFMTIKNSKIDFEKVYGPGLMSYVVSIVNSNVNITSTDACIFAFSVLELVDSIIDVNLLTDSEVYGLVPTAIFAGGDTIISGGLIHAKAGEGGIPYVGFASTGDSSFIIDDDMIVYPTTYELNRRHVILDVFDVDIYIFGNSNEDLGELPPTKKLDIEDVAQEIYLGTLEDIENYITPKVDPEEPVPNTADAIDYYVASSVVSLAVLGGIILSLKKRMN